MKRVFLLLMVASVALVPRAAYARPTTTIQIFHNEPSTLDGLDLCGESYDVVQTFDGVSQSTEFPDGHIEVRVTVTGTVVAEPTDGEGPTYTGTYTESFGFRLNPQNGSFTWVIQIVLKGSDGSHLVMQDRVHINQSASGGQLEFEEEICR